MNIETMQIEMLPTDALRPYRNNAKKHPQKQVERIANSIKRFGFKQPIIVDANNVIVVGHGRQLAAKRLGIKAVPCVRADDLTEEEINAFRLADNRVAESEWDFNALERELMDLTGFDMSDFGFDDMEFDSEPRQETPKTQTSEDDDSVSRLTHNVFENFERDFEPIYIGLYDIPMMEPSHTTAENFLRFCDWRGTENYGDYIAHFYYDDFKFINAWRDPDCYVERLRKFKAVIAPDFSLYTDFPVTLQILSCYRRQWVGAYWQSLGIDVIPDVIWGEEDSYQFCFDGIPKRGVVAVSSVGVKRDPLWNGEQDNLFKKGYDEMMRRLEPEAVLFYGDMVDGLEGNIIRIPSFYAQRRERLDEMKMQKRTRKV